MIKKKIMALLCPTLLLTQVAVGQCWLDKSNYHLVLHEDFAEGISVNDLSDPNHPRGVWEFDPGDPYWGWGDDWGNPDYVGNCDPNIDNSFGEYYDPSQVSIVADPNEPNDGILVLTAERIDKCSVHLITNNKQLNQNDPNYGLHFHRFPNFKSGMIRLRSDVASNTPVGCPHTFDNSPASGGTEGYTYGIFEARMKVAPTRAFPAFWLAGEAQINIYEGKDNPSEFMAGFNNWGGKPWAGIPAVGKMGYYRQYDQYSDLSDNFHDYTCVWTPTQISFFIDGREMATYTGTEVQDILPALVNDHSIIISHQVWYYVLNDYLVGDQFDMEVDYIKVYKPNNGDYSVSYKSDDNFLNHNTFDQHSGAVAAQSKARSITFNPQSATQLFYAGVDGNFYYLEDGSGDQSWPTHTAIGSPATAEEINGDLVFSQSTGKFLYRGNDGRLQYYHGAPGSWFHDYIDNNWGTSQYMMANDEAILATSSSTSNIFYKGTDQKIHVFLAGSGASHAWINHTYTSNGTENHYVMNDVLIEEMAWGDHVIYKGQDNRIQMFWLDQSQSPAQYVHAYIDNSGIANWAVKSTPGSMVMGDQSEIFYIGVDNKIQRFYYNGGWIHETLPYTYNSVGYWNGDYARQGIAYDPNARKVFYIGNDGRVQEFYEDGSGWQHGYVDDYWNTPLFSSYTDQASSSKRPSLIFDPGAERIHYLSGFESSRTFGDPDGAGPLPAEGPFDHKGYLKYFAWEPCANLDPDDDIVRPVKKGNPDGALTETNILASKKNYSSDGLLVYPNPSTDGVFKLKSLPQDIKVIRVVDSKGAVIKEYNTAVQQIDISTYPNGIYMLNVISDHGMQQQKIQVNQ